jgi:AcrR family transcriptional regulator
MAKRQAHFTHQDLAGDPRLQDDSAALWSAEFSEVARGLLSSAVRCFAGNGYQATTTRDISAGAGLSPGALYVHFATKELVLFEIIRVGHESALAAVHGPDIEQAPDAGARLHLIVSRYAAWHARHHVAARISQYELARLDPEHYEVIVELRHRTNEYFRETVARGVEDGTFAQVNVKRVVRGILSLGIDLIRWYNLEGRDAPETLGEFYADLALRMVAPTAHQEV